MPADRWLTANQNRLKWKIVEQIELQGYIPEIFSNTIRYIKNSIASPKAWSADAAYEIASQCMGAVIIGLPRWSADINNQTLLFASDFCQYEGAIFKSLQLPVLIVAQSNLFMRGVFDYTFGPTIGIFEEHEDETWVIKEQFMIVFDYWKNEMFQRRDIFLGYCTRSESTAHQIRNYLETELKVSVMDWQRDFLPGSNILFQIQEAAKNCFAGIFLFTKDDFLEENQQAQKAVPRDNVVFEAGYFIKAKGKGRVLIILEKGAKMPADLGGDIYSSLENIEDISTVKNDIFKFIDKL